MNKSFGVNVTVGQDKVTFPSDANGAPHHHGPSIINRLDATISKSFIHPPNTLFL